MNPLFQYHILPTLQVLNLKKNNLSQPLTNSIIFPKQNTRSSWLASFYYTVLKQPSAELHPKKRWNFRKKRDLQKIWPLDFFFNSRWLTKLLTKIRSQGKKGRAERVFLATRYSLTQHTSGNTVRVFHSALDQIKPVLSIVLRRVGRRIYEIPVPVYTVKQYKRVLSWLLTLAKKKIRVAISLTLAEEILYSVFFQHSEILKIKEALYDDVVRNRAYSHYRWI